MEGEKLKKTVRCEKKRESLFEIVGERKGKCVAGKEWEEKVTKWRGGAGGKRGERCKKKKTGEFGAKLIGGNRNGRIDTAPGVRKSE